MGWTITTDTSLRSQIAERTQGWENNNVRVECLTKTWRGSAFAGCLWAVFRTTSKLENRTETWIACFLMQYYRSKDYGDGWGYKEMTEEMGPCYYTCPLKYLDMADSGIDEEWRKAVREHHARNRIPEGFEFQAGMSLALRNCTFNGQREVKFVEKRGRWIIGTDGFNRCKLRPAQINFDETLVNAQLGNEDFSLANHCFREH